MRRVCILGATGSIGTQTLNVIEQYPQDFYACALAARSDSEGLFRLARQFRPECCALVKQTPIPEDLKQINWFFGENAAEEMLAVCRADTALCAVVGIAGLGAVLKALENCERVLLANKEALVTGGHLVMEKAKRLDRELIPVDSEHSAIFQCLKAAGENKPEGLILTCSGGALREKSAEEIENASVEDVLKHPTWRMGSKITVDCASLLNKGLEVIEAHYLFDMPLERIRVVIHPQSVIHSMVEFGDGAILAQLGNPDMRGPISYALAHPSRIAYGGRRLSLEQIGSLTFDSPDVARFPCLRYATEAMKAGGTAPVTLNGANEAAVEAFLKGEIRFGSIPRAIYHALDHIPQKPVFCVEDVFEADRNARETVMRFLKGERK